MLALVCLLLSVATSAGAMDGDKEKARIFFASPMNRNASPLDAQNVYGCTPLHYIAMLNNPITERIDPSSADLQKIDSERARTAANLIMMGKMSANVQDNNGKTPYDYALQGKKDLPLTYKVIAAGKTQEDINNTMREMMRTNTPIHINGAKFSEALSTLMRYLPKE